MDSCAIEFALRLGFPEPLPLESIELAFVYRLPPGPSQEVANYCGQLYSRGQVKRFGFVKTGPGSGAEGFDVFVKELGEAGVPEDAIVLVPYLYPDGHINTYFEAHSFGAFLVSQKQRLTRLGVVAQPYHLMRTVLTTVSCLAREGLEPKDVHLCPLGCPVGSWLTPVTHSQGVVKGCKKDLIGGEVKRIETYHAKGDLIDISHALEWL